VLPVSRLSLSTSTGSSSSTNADGAAGSAGLKQLLLAMSLQLLRWPQHKKWLVKINSGICGVSGLALLDTTQMQVRATTKWHVMICCCGNSSSSAVVGKGA